MGLYDFAVDFGDVVVRNLDDRMVLLALALLAAFSHAACFLLFVVTSLAIVSMKTPVALHEFPDYRETGTIVMGLLLIGFSLYFIIWIFFRDVDWQYSFLIMGAILILFGTLRRVREPDEKGESTRRDR